MAEGLDTCGSSEMASTQKDSSTAVRLLLERGTANKLDRLSTLSASKVSQFLDAAVAGLMLQTAILLAWTVALLPHAQRKLSREFLRTWIALQACNTMLASATQLARLIITGPVLPAGPTLQLDG